MINIRESFQEGRSSIVIDAKTPIVFMRVPEDWHAFVYKGKNQGEEEMDPWVQVVQPGERLVIMKKKSS